MSKQSLDKCVDPKVGKLLKQGLAGKLVKPGREKDLKAFEDHARKCGFCLKALVEHGYRVVGIPLLKKIRSDSRRRR